MTTVRRSVLVDRSAEQMFALVDAVEDYPQFLPWCGGAEVLERTPERTHARITVAYRGLSTRFSTMNRKEAPEWMHLDLEDGPFEKLQGHWRFVALGEGCRIEFALDYGFNSPALEKLLGSVFGHIADTMVDRFVERAESVPRR